MMDPDLNADTLIQNALDEIKAKEKIIEDNCEEYVRIVNVLMDAGFDDLKEGTQS